MKNTFSYWEKTTYFENTDFIVIGSGIVGLFTSLELRKRFPKAKILVLERGILPNGASTKNAGFCCFGSISELIDDLNHFSLDESIALVKLRYDGLKKLRNYLGDEAIGYSACGGYELFTKNDVKIFNNCLNNIDKYNRLFEPFIGKNVYNVDEKAGENNRFSPIITSVIKNNYEGSIDTGKMMRSMINKVINEGITVLNNIEITAFNETGSGVDLKTSVGKLNAKKLVVTTNGFAKQLLPDLDVEPARAQVLVTSEIKDLALNGTFHYDRGYNYFRNINGRVLLGGGRNLDLLAENTTEMETTQLITDHLIQMLREIILPGKDFTIDYQWSGIMGVGAVKKPIIKKCGEHIFAAVRMGGMGVAIGSKVGEMAAELIEKEANL